MSNLRGFGFTLDIRQGFSRRWYVGADGVQRWADNNEPVPGQKLRLDVDGLPSGYSPMPESPEPME